VNYHCFYHDAEKKAIAEWLYIAEISPIKSLAESAGMMPTLKAGSSGEDRQTFKLRFMEKFKPYLQECPQNGRNYIICGDRNIAHKEIDLKN
jgi:exodeoxyribonuclease-3